MRYIVSVFAVFLLCVPLIGLDSAGTFRATIPFDFFVGDQLLPAGEYVLNPRSPNFVGLREEGGSQAFTLNRQMSDSKIHPLSLVFNKYAEDKIFLSKIWLAPTSGREVVMSASEKALVTTEWRVQQIAVLLTVAKKRAD